MRGNGAFFNIICGIRYEHYTFFAVDNQERVENWQGGLQTNVIKLRFQRHNKKTSTMFQKSGRGLF